VERPAPIWIRPFQALRVRPIHPRWAKDLKARRGGAEVDERLGQEVYPWLGAGRGEAVRRVTTARSARKR
jgi:hypothetical protein